MRMYGGTDIGLERNTNQDNYYIDEQAKWAVVADGMGGHNGGETASTVAVAEIKTAMDKKLSLTAAIDRANLEVFKMSVENKTLTGMGTTVVLCKVDDDGAKIAHVGDSRAYLYSKGKLEQITKDHSIVQQLVDSGTLTEEQAKYHPQRNLITRAVGTERKIVADINNVVFGKDDLILICSDGLTSCVDDDKIVEIIEKTEEISVVDKLIEEANNNGGKDNITAVIIKA